MNLPARQSGNLTWRLAPDAKSRFVMKELTEPNDELRLDATAPLARQRR